MPPRGLALIAVVVTSLPGCNRGPLGGEEPAGWGTGWETGNGGAEETGAATVGDDDDGGADDGNTTFGDDDDGGVTTFGDDDDGATTFNDEDDGGSSFVGDLDDDGASFIGDWGDDGADGADWGEDGADWGETDEGATFLGDDDDDGGNSFIGDDGGGGGPVDPCPWMDRVDWDAPVDVAFAAEAFPELTPGSCSDTASPAAAIRWEVQETSEYNVDISSSNGPATFHLVRGDCAQGDEIICGGASEPVQVILYAGEMITFVVDDAGGASDILLEIDDVFDSQVPPGAECEPQTEDLIPFALDLPAADFEPQLGSCGAFGAVTGHQLTFEETGTYEIRANGTTMDHVLTVRIGHGCDGNIVRCEYAANGLGADHTLEVQAGDQYSIFLAPANSEDVVASDEVMLTVAPTGP